MSDITRTTEKTVVTVNVRRDKVVVTPYDHLTVEESKQLRKELKKAEAQAAKNAAGFIDSSAIFPRLTPNPYRCFEE